MLSRFLNSLLRLLAIATTSLAASMALAQIPQTINYQGYFTNAASQPVNAVVSITFRLYTAAAGGAPVWSETQSGVGVTNGIYNAVLGSATPMALPFNVPYFLSLQVNSDAEMSGRQPLSAVPYALRAVSADAVAPSAAIPATQLTGTLASSQFAATQLLPTTACTANQFSQWNGSAWICAAGTGTSTTSDVTGNLTMVNSTASAGNILKGGALFIHNSGGDSTFLGLNAGNSTATGTYNTGTGALVLGQLGNGYGNSAHGTWAMRDNTSGFFNTAGGAFALLKNTSGNSNTAFGNDALAALTSGNNNIAIGAQAGAGMITGSGNILIGHGGNDNDTGIVRIGRSNTHVKTFVAGIRGVSPGVADALPVVIDSNGQLGTGAVSTTALVSCSTEGDTAVIHNGAWVCRSALPHYVDNGDGTVTDNKTGLMWEKKLASTEEACLSAAKASRNVRCQQNTYSWTANVAPFTEPTGQLFSDFLTNLNDLLPANANDGAATPCFANYCDWRIPTRVELRSIILSQYPGCPSNPCIDAIFGPTQAAIYWSSTSVEYNNTAAWGPNFADGFLTGGNKINASLYARAVRSVR